MQLLGRASTIGAFVKRGEESGYIKISLRGNTKEEKITITRKIDTRNKSEWLFNGNIPNHRKIFLMADGVTRFHSTDNIPLIEQGYLFVWIH